jgi:hypothetical protein
MMAGHGRLPLPQRADGTKVRAALSVIAVAHDTARHGSLCLLMLVASAACNDPVAPVHDGAATLPPAAPAIPPKPSVDLQKTARKAEEALRFSREHGLSTSYAILIDMSLHSGVRRFFLWNFAARRIEHAALVGHGCCDQPWAGTESRAAPSFSNAVGSHCTALGKYRLGARKHSDWGIQVKYEMHGLEATNDNALKRFIVFHSWDAVSDDEIYPEGTPEGWGCPTLSNASMRYIDAVLQASAQPLLMWIYAD